MTGEATKTTKDFDADERAAIRDRARYQSHTKRAVPDDFTEMALTMSRADLCSHYRASNRTVTRWVQETKAPLAQLPAHNRRPVPDDFRQLAPTMTQNGLANHYGCMRETVARWASETGVCWQAYDRDAHLRQMMIRRNQVKKLPHGHFIAHKTTTLYDDAADTLRRERFPVYRCNEKGAADQKGAFWRVGWSVLTGEELLARAAKYQAKAA